MTHRNTLIDTARGLGILIVCVFHLIYRPENGLADKFIMSGIWLAIPLFFVISGYLHRDDNKLAHRVKSLLIPSLRYTLLLLVAGGIYCAIFHGYTLKDWARDFMLTYLRPEFSMRIMPDFIPADFWTCLLYDVISPVWFIWTMIFTLYVFYLLVKFTNRSFWNLLICCIVCVCMSTALYDFSQYFSWSLTLVPVYAAIMLCGAFIASREINLESGNIFAAMIAFMIHFAAFVAWGSSNIFMNVVGTLGRLSVIIFFAQVFVGGYPFIFTCRVFMNIKYIAGFLTLLGRNSLIFMFLHRPLGAIFSDMLGTYIKSGTSWNVDVTPEVFIKSLIVFALSMTLCTLLALVQDDKEEKKGVIRSV